MSGWPARLSMGMRLRCKLTHQLIDVLQGHDAHFIVRKITDRMRQFDHGMSFHPSAFELVHGCIFEYLREYDRRGYAALFELYRVVHTAQRA